MQNQFATSQLNIANILKEGFQEMQNQRPADRDTIANICATLPPSNASTPTPPPGNVVIPVPSNRSITSSLGDPPASGEINNTPTKSKKSQLDPPECIYPREHHKSTSFITSKPSEPIKSSLPKLHLKRHIYLCD
jgi:hypothetical protein